TIRRKGLINMNQNQQPQTGLGTNTPPQMQFGGHELMEVHEAIGTVTAALEHYALYDQYIQDQELKEIVERQRTFVTQMYNTILQRKLIRSTFKRQVKMKNKRYTDVYSNT